MKEYNGMKIGDYITTYNKGIYILEMIEERFVTQAEKDRFGSLNYTVGDSKSPLFYYRIAFDSNGTPKSTPKIKSCDAAHCGLAVDYIDYKIKNMEERIKSLKKIKKLC